MKASQPHDETVVEMLKADPEMADVYLATALEEANLPGGQFALLAALSNTLEALRHRKPPDVQRSTPLMAT